MRIGHGRLSGSGIGIEAATAWGSSCGRSSGPKRPKPTVLSRLDGCGGSPHLGQAVMCADAVGVKRSRHRGQQRWVMTDPFDRSLATARLLERTSHPTTFRPRNSELAAASSRRRQSLGDLVTALLIATAVRRRARRFTIEHGGWAWLLAGSPSMPAEKSEQTSLRSKHAYARNGSTVASELALRPGFSPQSLTATDGASCVTRREAWATGFDCGAGRFVYRHYISPVASVRSGQNARGFSPSSLRAIPTEGWESVKTMTRTEHGQAARRRGELARDRGSRRVSAAIDAQRRFNAQPASDTRSTADPFAPSDPRYGYLTRTGRDVRRGSSGT